MTRIMYHNPQCELGKKRRGWAALNASNSYHIDCLSQAFSTGSNKLSPKGLTIFIKLIDNYHLGKIYSDTDAKFGKRIKGLRNLVLS